MRWKGPHFRVDGDLVKATSAGAQAGGGTRGKSGQSPRSKVQSPKSPAPVLDVFPTLDVGPWTKSRRRDRFALVFGRAKLLLSRLRCLARNQSKVQSPKSPAPVLDVLPTLDFGRWTLDEVPPARPTCACLREGEAPAEPSSPARSVCACLREGEVLLSRLRLQILFLTATATNRRRG
jgi:hypothetical protein